MRHRSRVAGTILACGLAALAAALSACQRRADSPAAKGLAQLVQVEGSVSVQRGETPLAGAVNAPLYANDVVVTAAGSRALIRYEGGSEIEVGESTRFRIGVTNQGRLTLTLDEGTLLSRGGKGQGASGGSTLSLSILTSFGETPVLEGSEVRFTLRGAERSIGVVFGETSLVDDSGNVIPVIAGETLDLTLKRVAKSPTAPQAEEPKLVFARERGAPKLRPRGEGRFSPVGANPTPVAEGTAFRLDAADRGTLKAKGLQIRLPGKAAGELGAQSTDPSGAERYAVTLDSGEADVDFTGAVERTLALGGGGQVVELKASADAAARWIREGKTARLDVRVGQVDLLIDGAKHTVAAGQQATLDARGLTTAPTRRPALALPNTRKLRVYVDGRTEVALLLGKEDPSATVQVATDAAFTDLLFSGRTAADFVVAWAKPPDDLYWRKLGADGVPEPASHARFERDRGRSSLVSDNPNAEVNDTGEKAVVHFQSAPPRITLVYRPQPGAVKYRVSVYREGDKSMVAEKLVDSIRCAFEPGQLGEGEYFWLATPLDASGNPLAGRQANKLRLVYDNSRNSLAIARPSLTERARPGKVETQGVAPLGSTLYVNGKLAPLDPKGRFSMVVSASDAIVYRLRSDNGHESYWIRRLRKER